MASSKSPTRCPHFCMYKYFNFRGSSQTHVREKKEEEELQLNPKMENGEDGESEQPGNVNIGQSLALRKMMEMIEPTVLKIIPRVLKPMVISAVQEVIRPIVEVSLRKVVQEEIQKFEEKFLTAGTRNDLPKERNLQLRFLDEAPDTVQTGNGIRGIKGEWLKLALYDASSHIVTCGHESSARVEIILLDASNDDENNTTPENFESRIIRAGDKEKPHFAKIVYINLKKGVGILNDLKLGHGVKWTKSCNCRLGARVVANFVVQEAWTRPFKVIDKRGKHYGKHNTPFPYSEVWRLNGLGRDGEPLKRLTEKNIKTVLDFLFWLSVNPNLLQEEMLGAGDVRWNTIVTHAQTCIIDDKKMYSHESSTEPQMRVIYDAVGKLKGVIDKSHFVPIDNLSADKMDRARKLLRSVLEEPSAFGERYNTSFDDKDALLKEFPYISSDSHASPNSSIQLFSNRNDLTLSKNIHGYQTADRYEKRETPSLSDEVSQLVNICEDGEIHKRLQDNTISTVEDFPIQLLRDDEGLKRIVNLEGQKWETTVNEARPWPSAGSRMYCYTNLQQKSQLPQKLLKVLSLSGGENQINATESDYMEMMVDAETPDNRGGECIDEESFFQGADDEINFLKGQFSNFCVGSNGNRKWELLVYVLKWRFSIKACLQPHHHLTRKRKR